MSSERPLDSAVLVINPIRHPVYVRLLKRLAKRRRKPQIVETRDCDPAKAVGFLRGGSGNGIQDSYSVPYSCSRSVRMWYVTMVISTSMYSTYGEKRRLQ
jgi:hypothetical protein